MATNLRLRPEAEAALRDAAERTGRSQQELIREAVDQYLQLGATLGRSSFQQLVDAGLVIPSRTRYRRAENPITLPEGMTTADLLDRDDRF